MIGIIENIGIWTMHPRASQMSWSITPHSRFENMRLGVKQTRANHRDMASSIDKRKVSLTAEGHPVTSELDVFEEAQSRAPCRSTTSCGIPGPIFGLLFEQSVAR